MTKTRWGILGAAKIAREHLAPAIVRAEGAELAAIATRSPDRAGPFLDLNANLTVHGSYNDLLNDPSIDAIYIPLPNEMHTPWTIKALEAGKAVLVEKPAALNLAEMDQLIEARDRTGCMAAEAYMIVHHPQWQKMRALIQGGVLGNLQRVHGVFTYDNSGDPSNIRRKPEHYGGSVPDIGVYPYGAVRFVTGQEPLKITHVDLLREAGVDLTATVFADFEGFKFSATTSMGMRLWQNMEFHGDKALVRLSAPFNAGVFGEATLEIFHADGRLETHRWPNVDQYALQIEAFQRAMKGEAYDCPLEFSRGTQAMLDTILAN